MYQSVYASWENFSRPLEGRVAHMYVDVLNLITVGVGNLIDPVSQAIPLPFKHKDGTLATQAEIRNAWNALKNHPGLMVNGTLKPLKNLHYKYAEAVTNLYLDDADIDKLVRQRMDSNEAYLKKVLPNWNHFPADAQLAIMSMAWAVGAGFMKKFPTLTKYLLASDWGTWDPTTKTGTGAAGNCTIREAGNPGVVPRNARNRMCFTNAGIVQANGMDISVLHWPSVAIAPSAPVAEPLTGDPVRLFELAEEAADMARRERNEQLSGVEPEDDSGPNNV